MKNLGPLVRIRIEVGVREEERNHHRDAETTKGNATVSKLLSPKSSGIFRRSRRILLPEPLRPSCPPRDNVFLALRHGQKDLCGLANQSARNDPSPVTFPPRVRRSQIANGLRLQRSEPCCGKQFAGRVPLIGSRPRTGTA